MSEITPSNGTVIINTDAFDERNLAKARRSPQSPRLQSKGYLARVDLPVALGSGQAGVARQDLEAYRHDQ